MKKTFKSKLHILRMLLAALLILASLPTAAYAAKAFSAIVTSDSMKVYRDASLDDYWGRLPENTVVRVKAYAGKVALITYGGRMGFASVSDMKTVESVSVRAKTTRATRVYEEPDLSSNYAKVKKGIVVNVLAVDDNCATVERNGYVGYAYTGHLKFEETGFFPDMEVAPEVDDNNDAVDNDNSGEQQPDAGGQEEEPAEDEDDSQPEATTPAPSIEDVFASGQYTNEQLCYYYMVYEMKLNPAAAVGVMSNLRSESGYRPNASGDNSNSYGVVQWYKSRKERLFDWCEEKGYDHSTLLAQLRFMEYELKTYYPKVDSYIRSVEDSSQGAFDAAYYFCYHYESPSNRAAKSTERGIYARDTIYPEYAAK